MHGSNLPPQGKLAVEKLKERLHPTEGACGKVCAHYKLGQRMLAQLVKANFVNLDVALDLFVNPPIVEFPFERVLTHQAGGKLSGFLQRRRVGTLENPSIKLGKLVFFGPPNRKTDSGVLAGIRVWRVNFRNRMITLSI